MNKNTIQVLGFFTPLFIAVTIAIVFYDPSGKNYLVPITSLSLVGLMICFGFGFNRKKHNKHGVEQ